MFFALLLVLTFGAWGQIFSYYYEPARAGDTGRMLVSVVNLVRTALINVDTDRRSDLLIALAALEKIHIYPAESEDEIEPLPDNREMRLIVAEVRRSLGDDTRFASSWKTLKGFWISFRLAPSDHGEYWVMLPLERIRHQSAAAWLSWGGAALLAAILGAYLIASRVSMPLRQLAQAARQVGKGETPVPFEEEGPQEITVVAKAFNQMADNLARAAADRSLLLAGVSHDLRTPLARLRLEIELLDISEADNTAMITDIEAMDRIIGQFLDYGRGTAQEAAQSVDLVEMLADIINPYRLRGILINDKLPPQLSAHAYSLPLRRAFINLIDNALRYAGEDKALDIRAFPGRDDTVCVEIADRGPGIPPDEVERMRQPFTRMEPARSNTSGAGLGLAIVDRIVQMHHGRLYLLPRGGGGLRAIIRIPALGLNA